MEVDMSEFGDLLKGIAAAMWVVLAVVVFLTLRHPLAERVKVLTKLGLSPTGLSMEFAEKKLDEAVSGSDEESKRAIGEVAKRSVLDRLERNADLLSRARILWVDDHPENNTPIIELLRQFGARVETPRSNDEAFALLRANRYDVIISDVARDREGPDSDLKGVKLAETVFSQWGQRVVLFTARFDPTGLPGVSDADRLAIARLVGKVTFGRTNRFDEVLHLILDMVERQQL
jgi:CheY-like chemotaxis protein